MIATKKVIILERKRMVLLKSERVMETTVRKVGTRGREATERFERKIEETSGWKVTEGLEQKTEEMRDWAVPELWA